MGHVGSTTKSLGQIVEQSSEHFRDRFFDLSSLKFCQKVDLDDIAIGAERVMFSIAHSQVSDSRASWPSCYQTYSVARYP